MRLLDVDALLPKDFEVSWRGRRWRIPGGLSVETAFRLEQARNAYAVAVTVEEVIAAYQDLAQALQEVLYTLNPPRRRWWLWGPKVALAFISQQELLALLTRILQGLYAPLDEGKGADDDPNVTRPTDQ